MHGHVHRTQTLLLVTVHVFGVGVSGLPASIDKGAVQWVMASPGADMQRPAVAPVQVTPLGAGFGLSKIRQAISIRPLTHAGGLRPAVVIERMAADVDHAID